MHTLFESPPPRGQEEASFDDSETEWFRRTSAPPSIEHIRFALRSSAPPPPPATPIGDDLVDEWLA